MVAGPSPSTGAASAATLALVCRIEKPLTSAERAEPDWGSDFTLTVPFGEGSGLALVDPDTQRIERMLFASDVLIGQFSAHGASETVAWTRASSARAPLLGHIIRSDGHMIVVSLARAGETAAARTVRLYETASGALWSGRCAAAT